MIYLYFNIIGVIVTGVLFYGAESIFGFDFMDNTISSIQIAVVNTAFKIFSTIVLLPFSKQLEFLAVKSIRDKGDEKEKKSQPLLIDERFLKSPA